MESKNLLKHASELIRYMPVDSNTSDMLTPLFDFTNTQEKLSSLGQTPQTVRMMKSGLNNQKARSVSETKKKYVASQQNWNCKMW